MVVKERASRACAVIFGQLVEQLMRNLLRVKEVLLAFVVIFQRSFRS